MIRETHSVGVGARNRYRTKMRFAMYHLVEILCSDGLEMRVRTAGQTVIVVFFSRREEFNFPETPVGTRIGVREHSIIVRTTSRPAINVLRLGGTNRRVRTSVPTKR